MRPTPPLSPWKFAWLSCALLVTLLLASPSPDAIAPTAPSLTPPDSPDLYTYSSAIYRSHVEFGTPYDASSTGDPGTLRPLLSEPEGVPVEEVTLDRFLAGHIEDADPADPVARQNRARFQHLKDVLRLEISGIRVFRVGETEKRCYLLGRTPGGDLAGLRTTAYET